MKRNTGIRLAVVGISVGAWCGGAWGNGVVVRLVNPGSATMTSGTPFELRVVADIASARLSAVAYDLSVTGTGDARAWLNRRSADPNEVNGLTYISQTLQFPFENNLAHNFAASDQSEVMADMDYDDEPGGESDGIEPNTNVVLERIWITPTGTGSLTITLSNFTAVTTEGDPNGAFFDTMTIDANQVSVTVNGPAYYWLSRGMNRPDKGEIVIDPAPGDPNVPVYAVGTPVELTGDGTSANWNLEYWLIYDPNYPEDANHAFEDDANNPIVVVMDSDRAVDAYFRCGSGLAPLMALSVGILGVAWLVRRRGHQ
jgi:hypothetical protein